MSSSFGGEIQRSSRFTRHQMMMFFIVVQLGEDLRPYVAHGLLAEWRRRRRRWRSFTGQIDWSVLFRDVRVYRWTGDGSRWTSRPTQFIRRRWPMVRMEGRVMTCDQRVKVMTTRMNQRSTSAATRCAGFTRQFWATRPDGIDNGQRWWQSRMMMVTERHSSDG